MRSLILISLSCFLFCYCECMSSKRVLVWMCLERWYLKSMHGVLLTFIFSGGNSTTIESNLQQISDHRDILTSVAFEKYNLGAHSTLVSNNLTDVTQTIQSYGLETWPMVSSYPYPPQFILWMREVFRNPQPFIDSCISEAQKYGYTGYNIDWEPAYGGNSEDALNYATFIDTLSKQLHQHNVKVSVDCATWSPVWNLTALSNTSVDYLLDMGTYTNSDSSFMNQLETAVNEVGIEKLGVGLEVLNPETGVPFEEEQIVWRINQIESYSCNEIDVWDEPLPDFWWPLLEDFVNS